jgi:hypothetical protein
MNVHDFGGVSQESLGFFQFMPLGNTEVLARGALRTTLSPRTFPRFRHSLKLEVVGSL